MTDHHTSLRLCLRNGYRHANERLLLAGSEHSPGKLIERLSHLAKRPVEISAEK